MTALETVRWAVTCRAADLPVERGVAALLAGTQVAIFRTHDASLYAIGNQDPFSGAYVLSRGIVGTHTVDGADVPTVASPLHKQHFDLRTGTCLEAPDVAVPTFAVRERDGVIEVCVVP